MGRPAGINRAIAGAGAVAGRTGQFTDVKGGRRRAGAIGADPDVVATALRIGDRSGG